jgi:peptidoglycan/LPS O-acetylase OafA/YrhL
MNERLSIIDGFRCLAIMAVVIYHYCYRFSPPMTTENLYPYTFESSIFKYGFFGVQFFFVISGFVILKTLESTPSFVSFFLKRLIRLWPALFFCSLITYLMMGVSASNNGILINFPTVLNFIPSLTMTTPAIWNFLLGRSDISYIDGVHWSLFTEMVFYFLAATIYFLHPKSFLKSWTIFVFALTALRLATSPKLQFLFPDQVNVVFSFVYHWYFWLTLNHLVYFSAGILFYHRYSTGRFPLASSIAIALLCILELYFLGNLELRVLWLLIVSAFLVLIHRPTWFSLLANRAVVWIGVVSYPLYLLHENIGVLLIRNLAPLTASFLNARLLPVIVTCCMIISASFVFIFIEKPISRVLRKKFLLSGR